MASAEREPKMGVWGRDLSGVQGQSPGSEGCQFGSQDVTTENQLPRLPAVDHRVISETVG